MIGTGERRKKGLDGGPEETPITYKAGLCLCNCACCVCIYTKHKSHLYTCNNQ